MSAIPPPAASSSVVLLMLPDRLLASALAIALRPSFPRVLVGHRWDDLEDHLDTMRPAITVTDVALEQVVLTAHLGQLASAHPRTHFVVTSAVITLDMAIGLLTSGVAVVTDRTIDAPTFGSALSMLHRDGRWPPGVGWSQAVLTEGRTPLHAVPARARQVLDLLFAGATHVEIAKQLRVSVKSVERRVAELRRAYGVAPRMPGPWEQGHRGRPSTG